MWAFSFSQWFNLFPGALCPPCSYWRNDGALLDDDDKDDDDEDDDENDADGDDDIERVKFFKGAGMNSCQDDATLALSSMLC